MKNSDYINILDSLNSSIETLKNSVKCPLISFEAKQMIRKDIDSFKQTADNVRKEYDNYLKPKNE